MKKILYSNGDSFTFGMEILEPHSKTQDNKLLSYPIELSKLLNIGIIRNESYCGATNEFIFRKTIEHLLEMEASGINPKDVFVVVGWTSICRAEITALNLINNNGDRTIEELKKICNLDPEFQNFETFFINVGSRLLFKQNGKTQVNTAQPIIDFLVEYIWRDDLEYEKWFVQQEALTHFLNNKGYEYLMLNTTQKFDFNKFSDCIKNLMTFDSRYIDPINFSMHDWANEFYPNERMPHGHPTKKVHQKFAEYLYQYIIDNNIIKSHSYE